MLESLRPMTDSLLGRSGDILPRFIGAIALLIIGSIIASFLRRLVKRLLNRSGIDNRLNGSKSANNFSFSKMISSIVYYLIMTYIFILVLSMMGVEGVLAPLQNMLDTFFSFLPNIIAAGIIGFAGYMLAKLLSEAVSAIATGFDTISDRINLPSTINISKLLGQIVFLFVFIPILLIAIDTLKIDVISGPAKQMLTTMFSAIPKIIASAIILTVFYIGGKYVISIIVELLGNLGVDELGSKMGISSLVGNRSLAKLIGNVAFFFLMFAGLITATENLNFGQLSVILNDLFRLSGQIAFGTLILLAGNHISKLVSGYVAGTDNAGLATIVRYATLALFIAIGLKSMGIADDIVNLAFGLILGAVAIAFALSFGLGGREAAGRHMDEFLTNLRNKK